MKLEGMTLDAYQTAAAGTATGLAVGPASTVYCGLALAGEAGEAAEIVKKAWRNDGLTDGGDYTETMKLKLALELGDILWYVGAQARNIGYNLSQIALMNLEKLADRRARRVICDQGDDR